MMNKQSFSQLAKLITRSNHGLRDPQLMRPNRDWRIGLVLAILIFVTSAVWSTKMYLSYREASVEKTDLPEEGVVVYRASLVEAALSTLEKREAAHEKLLGSVEVIQVPEEVPQVEEAAAETESASTSEDVIREEATTTEMLLSDG